MSAPDDTEVVAPVLAATDEESALFSTANGLLILLTRRLKDRPHGQISLVQLPDVFLIKAQLEQLVELEVKKVKHQETLIQMAVDREEEGGKGLKKRVKNSGTQATAIRLAVTEEVESKTADLQRYTASMEDRLKKAEKLLENSINENKCLADKCNFLAADLNKFIKTPKSDEQQVMQSLLEPLEARIKTREDKAAVAHTRTNAIVKCIQADHERVNSLFKYDKIDDERHGVMSGRFDELVVMQKANDERYARALKHRKVHVERLDDQEKVADGLQTQINSANERLADVVGTVDRNAALLDSMIRDFFKHIRFLQIRLQATLMPLWNTSTNRMERVDEYVEDED